MILRPRERGFTLIELMLVLGMATILGATFFGIMYTQTLSFLQRFDEVDAHQSARASINILRRYLRNARYGFASDQSAGGIVPLGMCYNAANTLTSQGACNDVDSVTSGAATYFSDRMRVMEMVDDGSNQFAGSNTGSSNGQYGPCNGSNASAIYITKTLAPFTAFPTLAAVAGPCNGGSNGVNYASDVVTLTGTSPSGTCQGFTYQILGSGGTTTSCGSNAYGVGFNFGKASVADFYVRQDPTSGVPALMLRVLDPNAPTSPGYIVAYDVESLQLKYGINVDDPTNGPLFVSDPRIPSDGGQGPIITVGPTPVTLTTALNYNRIVAMDITVQVRTDAPRANLIGTIDNYMHYTYHARINLRNNNL